MLKRTLLEWFLIVYFFAWLVRGIWFTLHLPPLGVIIALSLLALFIWAVCQSKIVEKREETRKKHLGYRVTYIAPNTLRRGHEEWAFEYREQDKSFLLYGDKERKKLPHLDIPSSERWDSIVSEWAKGQRQEILARVREEMVHQNYATREV